MTTQKAADAHTGIRRVRVPDLLWDAYETVCSRLGRDRSKDLLEHIRTTIREHGTPEELAALDQADAELEERRARKGGRPRRQLSTES